MTVAGKPVLTLTDAAAARVRALVAGSKEGILGLRVGVSSKGCSGLSYTVDYAREQRPFEEVVEQKGVRVFIDPGALMFLIGETARCGCGESFSVAPDARAV